MYSITITVPIHHDYFIRTGQTKKTMGIKTPASIKKIIYTLCQGNKARADTAFNLLHELGDYQVTAENHTIWTIEYTGQRATFQVI